MTNLPRRLRWQLPLPRLDSGHLRPTGTEALKLIWSGFLFLSPLLLLLLLLLLLWLWSREPPLWLNPDRCSRTRRRCTRSITSLLPLSGRLTRSDRRLRSLLLPAPGTWLLVFARFDPFLGHASL